jgi:hydrogenase/urease accessory protein HupE
MIRPIRIYAAIFLTTLLVIAAPREPAYAHSMDIASALVEVDGQKANVTIMFDGTRVASLDRDKDGIVNQAELDADIENMFGKLKNAITFTGPNAPKDITLTRYEITGEQHIMRFVMSLNFAAPIQKFAVTARMSALLDDPAPLVIKMSGPSVSGEAMISADGESASFASPWSTFDVFQSFVVMGVKHIFTGYDHLTFLMCLLIGATSTRSLIWTVTAFTLAHSVTLSAATLDLVRLPGPLVETAIAATIIYVAVENLIGSQLVKRPFITGVFGLIHGFGFASVLRDVGIPPGNTVVSLFAFNLGVEIGQLIFVGVAFVLLGRFLKSNKLRIAVSVAAVCVALYWFFERAVTV